MEISINNNIMKIDNILECFSNLEESNIRGQHQYLKTGNMDILKEVTRDFINETIEFNMDILKEVTRDFINETIEFRKMAIGESFSPFRLLEAKSNLSKKEVTVNDIENFTKKVIKENYEIKNNTITDLKRELVVDDEYGVIENYLSLANIILQESISCMCDESSYVIKCLENMQIITEADENTKETTEVNKSTKDKIKDGAQKLGSKTKEVGKKLFAKLKEFLNKIKNMFKAKIEKLRGRDLKWLQENKKAILNAKVDNLEVNVHSDYKDSYETMIMRSEKYLNLYEGMRFDDPKLNEKMEANAKNYSDKNGNLKQGLINFYRTGMPKKEVTVVTLRGNEIKNNLGDFYNYCDYFLDGTKRVLKQIQDLEKKLNDIEREMDRRNITENFCYIENDLLVNTDLALCENFHLLLEADEPKLGVQQRNETRETTDKLSDKGVSGYNKLFRDEHLGLTAFLTASEQKYFELIKILKAIVK